MRTLSPSKAIIDQALVREGRWVHSKSCTDLCRAGTACRSLLACLLAPLHATDPPAWATVNRQDPCSTLYGRTPTIGLVSAVAALSAALSILFPLPGACPGARPGTAREPICLGWQRLFLSRVTPVDAHDVATRGVAQSLGTLPRDPGTSLLSIPAAAYCCKAWLASCTLSRTGNSPRRTWSLVSPARRHASTS